jgi:hypothetical protein
MCEKLAASRAVIRSSTCKKRSFFASCHSPTEVHYPDSVGVSVLVHRSTGTGALTGLGAVVCNPGGNWGQEPDKKVGQPVGGTWVVLSDPMLLHATQYVASVACKELFL